MSDHDQPVAPNLLDRQFTAERPNQRWVGDTTELVTGNGKLFLAVIPDLFSKYVVGWALSPSNDRFVTMRALDMAIRRRCPDAGLVHHSDQGSTYASEDYRKVLTAHGITRSMCRKGNVFDNTATASWNSTFKLECGERFPTNVGAEEAVFDYIEAFHNQQRRHSAIGYEPGRVREGSRGSVSRVVNLSAGFDQAQVLAGIVYRLRTGCQWNALRETSVRGRPATGASCATGVFTEIFFKLIMFYNPKRGIQWK